MQQAASSRWRFRWRILGMSAGSARDIGVSSVWIDWVLLRVILPQIALITQRNAASCIIAQTKTVRDGDVRLLKFWGVSAIICERHWGFVWAILIVYACVLFSRRSRRGRRRMQQAALFRRERQIGVSLAWGIVVLLFICDYLRDLREILWFLLCGLLEYSCVLFSRR